jgi:hypothetical protein
VLLRSLLGLIEQGKLLFLAGAGLFLGLRAVDDQVQETKALLQLGNLRLMIGDDAFEDGGVVGEGVDVHSPNNIPIFSI